MQIPNEFKKAWFGLATIAIIIVLIFLVIVGAKLAHGRPGDSMPATITVNGKGEVQATPDISKFNVTVEETAKDQSAALAATSTKVNAIIDSLRAIGIEEKDIKTEYTSVNPKYEFQKQAIDTMMYPAPANQVIVGYTSSHTLSVKVRNLDNVAAVQKAFTEAKVQNVSGPDLSVDDPDALKLEARAQAINDATEQAKILAKQLRVRLGKVVSFNESGEAGGVYPMMMSARADVAMKVANPEATVATGEQTITSNVSVTYRIR